MAGTGHRGYSSRPLAKEDNSSSIGRDASDSGYGTGSAVVDSETESDSRAELQGRLLRACQYGRLVDVRELVAGKKVALKNCIAKNPHGDTPLHISAYFGHKSIVEYLVEEADCDVESKNKYNNTPLHRAARQGKLEVVKYLIEEKNSDPMAACVWRRTPLHNACKNGRLEVVKYLISDPRVDRFAKDNSSLEQTPLQLAAEHGTVEVVQHMMEHGAGSEQPGHYTLLHLAAYSGKPGTVQYLIQNRGYDPMIKDKDGKTPLHSACLTGKLEIIKYLVDTSKVDVASCDNRYQESPLDMAAQNGHIDTVRYLVEEKNCVVEHGTSNRNTALHHAAWGEALEVMKYFIEERKCNPSCQGRKGRTPLHIACTSSSKEVLDYLIDKHQVEVSCRGHDGATPLHLAARRGHLSLVKRLINKFRCDHFLKDNDGKTASDYAADKNHTAIVKYLSRVHKIASDEWRKNLEKSLKAHTLMCTPTGVKLGIGAYSTVIQLTQEGDKTICLAGKVFKISETKEFDQKKLIKEINIMVEVDHPNIVRCKGVCFLPSSKLPVLVMEQLVTNLHAYLLSSDNSDLPVERKISFLLDTARGLDYLHSHTPAIIHRDLTAKNVLLDSQLRAKISDFGNSRIMELDSDSSPGSMTTLPGTPSYMPPEAQEKNKYGPSLDIFSFGHLSLFTVVQTPLRPLLPPTYADSASKPQARSEVERREQFMKKAEELLSDSHLLIRLIKQCLHISPQKRPSAGDLVAKLEMAVAGTYSVALSAEPGDDHTGTKNATSGDGTVFPVIRGADIIAQTKIKIPPDQPLDFQWEGHGFKVHIPAGAISGGPVTLCIQASLSGDYQLPDDDGGGVLVSGVYWLSLHPPVKRFYKKVTITLQHCASDDDSALSFITAKCTQKTLPYTFKPLPGGAFFEPQYGSLESNHFSAFGVSGGKISNYAILTYYISKQQKEVHITVTKNLKECLKSIKRHYKEKEEGDSTTAEITGDKISLHIEPDPNGIPEQNWTKDGWELSLLVSATLQKKVIDEYNPGRVIPHFSIGLELENTLEPKRLQQKVKFVGVTPQEAFITISRCAPSPALQRRIQSELNTQDTFDARPLTSCLGIDDLFDVKVELQRAIARWKAIGLALRLNPGQLKAIEKENRDLDDCLTEMLTLWLNMNYNSERFGEPSWELLASAVGHRAGGNNPALAKKITKRHA